MFLNTTPISKKHQNQFLPLFKRGITIQIVFFNENETEVPVFLALYNGRVCHFGYVEDYTEKSLEFTIDNIIRFFEIKPNY